MKAILVLALYLSSFSVFGQKLYVRADTLKTENPYILAIQKEVNEQALYLESLALSPMSEKRGIREISNFTRPQPETYEVKIGSFTYYTKDSISTEDKVAVKLDMQRRAERVHSGHYNLFFLAPFLDTTQDISKPLFFARHGEYFKGDATFEVNSNTRQPAIFDELPFGVKPGDIYFKYYMLDRPREDSMSLAVPIHEFSHMSTDGNKYLRYETSLFLGKLVKTDRAGDCENNSWFNTFTGSIYCYYDNPTEVKARLDVLRYLLYKQGYYDARFEEFTFEHLRFILTDRLISENANVKELIIILESNIDYLIWMMNNIQ